MCVHVCVCVRFTYFIILITFFRRRGDKEGGWVGHELYAGNSKPTLPTVNVKRLYLNDFDFRAICLWNQLLDSVKMKKIYILTERCTLSYETIFVN